MGTLMNADALALRPRVDDPIFAHAAFFILVEFLAIIPSRTIGRHDFEDKIGAAVDVCVFDNIRTVFPDENNIRLTPAA